MFFTAKKFTLNTNPGDIDAILDRGTIVEIYPKKEDFRKKLLSGERLRFYIGFDATAATLHLSHAKNLMLLEDFRKLGHEVIILFGDFTAQIGDPSGESETRNNLSRAEVMANVEEWKRQITPLMNFTDKVNPPLIKYNHDWLSKLSFEDVIKLSSNFTVQQMIERDMFDKRLKGGKPIYLNEFLYPLMQGYDSVSMEVDVELCGTDQTFNALAGRTLLRKLKDKEKYVVAVTLMPNPKTNELMSKSKGTGVFLNSNSSDMYGAVMAQPDEMVEILFTHTTRISLDEIKKIISGDPKSAKMRLAFETVKTFHGESLAKEAEESFEKTFSKGGVSDDAKEVSVKLGEKIGDVLLREEMVSSKNELRRLISSGAVTNMTTDKKVEDIDTQIESDGDYKIGKRRFIKIKVN